MISTALRLRVAAPQEKAIVSANGLDGNQPETPAQPRPAQLAAWTTASLQVKKGARRPAVGLIGFHAGICGFARRGFWGGG